MNRVSTASAYANVLANIQRAQTQQYEANAQLTSQKKSDDYKGYSRNAEVLTAMRGVQAKVDGFIDQNKMLTSKIETQASGLARLSEASMNAREAIADSVASDNADTLMLALEGFFRDAVSAINSKHGGRYLFSGGQVNDKPVEITTLTELNAAASTASVFKNDTFKVAARLDESTSTQTGFLADEVATDLFDQLKAIQDYVETNGGFNGTLTEAQKTFLQGMLPEFDKVYNGLTAVEGQNGVIQNQIDNARKDLNYRQDMLEGMTSDITDVDPAEAVANFQTAQLSVQAAAQVFAALKGSSLLEILS